MALNKHWWIVSGGTEAQAMTTGIRVAFATSDRKRVDQHFGTACALAIYAITPEQASLVEFAQFGELEADGHEDKLAAKLALLRECAVVYCEAVGGSAIQQLLSIGVQPIRVEANAAIAPLLTDLQTALRGGAPAWLNRAIARQRGGSAGAGARFAAMEAEGWQE